MNLNIKTVIGNYKFLGCAVLAAAALWSAPVRAADGAVTYKATPGSEVRIDGDSTAHEWYMIGSMIGGFLELPAGTQLDCSKETIDGLKDGKLDAKVSAIVNVRSVHSVAKVGSSIMDGLYQDALREKANPKITYNLTEMTLTPGHKAGEAFKFDTKGELQIGGVTNKISMPVTITNVDKTKITIVGSVPLKMTDFKIDPPAPNIGLGLMKCKDDVKVSFKWLLSQPAETK